MKYRLGDNKVKTGKNCFIAETASVIGDVTLGNDVSIWPGASLRGDANAIIMGDESNAQDCCVLHVTEKQPLKIGKRVNIGHSAVLHSCTVGDNVLIGINAIILDGAVIGDNCIIGANAMVTMGKVIPSGSLVLGSPGKVVRELDEEGIRSIADNVDFYLANKNRYLKEYAGQQD